MRSVHLILHALAGVDARYQVPTQALSAFFRCFGIDLSFTSGESILSSPTHLSEYQAILRRWYPTDPPLGSAAHLFVGTDWLDTGGPTVNGMLLDLKRGAVAVFTGSSTLSKHPDRLEQICAHEICHLLNLTHPVGPQPYMATESPAEERDSDNLGPDFAWERMGRSIPPGVSIYPLSEAGANHLRASADVHVLPWGTPYFGGALEAEDRAARSAVFPEEGPCATSR